MRVEAARPGARGVDTILTFGPTRAAAIKSAGFEFIVRYLGSLTTLERNVILNANLALMAVTYSRRPSWLPSGGLGDADGQHAVQNARLAGLPESLTLFVDVEGPGGRGEQTIDYVNAWADRVVSAGYNAGLYVGYGIQLTPEQLYHRLKVTSYWHSCSKVQDVAHRGYDMVQEYPGNQHVAGLQVDLNHVQSDAMGQTPNWLIGDP